MKDQERFLKKYRGNECLNCGVPLDIIDKYCHNCGQANTTKRLSFKDFFSEFFASIFSYDSKLRHTVVALLFKPGKISKEYIEGKRIKYSNPFRFYLSVSIIFFIINGMFIDFDYMSNQLNTKEANTLKKEIKTTSNNEINNSEESIFTPYLTSKENTSPVYYSESQLDTMSGFEDFNNRLKTYTRYYKKTNELSPETALDNLGHEKNWYNKYLYKRSLKTYKLSDNPIALFEFVFNKLPFIIFFFLPFFAIVLWIFYFRRSFTYMEHLIFTFHTQTMFFFLIGISYLIDEILGNETAFHIAIVTFLIYLFIAMRKFYQQNNGKTFFKFIFINLSFIILAGIGSVLILVGSIFIF
ncbi:DUF3667 domain-containing protein [Aquimarina sp. 2201CG1-2-11]|uniref:DUF3667 domain-containing protein n=1 Tax=Aquimarina discodermiae TaxID=3231043 RepID=UPI003461D8B2